MGDSRDDGVRSYSAKAMSTVRPISIRSINADVAVIDVSSGTGFEVEESNCLRVCNTWYMSKAIIIHKTCRW